MNRRSFSELALPAAQLQNLESLGYKEMTPIQADALPAMLDGRDVIAEAETGSGKTAAFSIAMLQRVEQAAFNVQGLVLCPTRELCQQVAQEVRRLARHRQNIKVAVLCGGQHINLQIDTLEKGAHVVIGTPGRIQDHLRRSTLKLKSVNTVVLDEADRMLEMGFIDEIDDIISEITQPKQMLLFSATYPERIEALSQQFQRDPVRIKVEAVNKTQHIEQIIYQREHGTKHDFLQAILQKHKPESAILFCNMKETVREVADFLRSVGHSVLELHGDLEQFQRDQALMKFTHRSCALLVATDVAARGLDIKDLPMVINYDLPSSPETYVHRIGRTGREGKAGLAVSLINDKRTYHLTNIESYLGIDLPSTQLNTKSKAEPIALKPAMMTFQISGGKKDKVRAGDILGALTGDMGMSSKHIGKIDVFDHKACVAVDRSVRRELTRRGQGIKIKGRVFKVRQL